MTIIIMYLSLFITRHIRNEKKSSIYFHIKCKLIESYCSKHDELSGFYVRTGELSTGEGGIYSGMGELVSHCGEKMLIIVRTRLL